MVNRHAPDAKLLLLDMVPHMFMYMFHSDLGQAAPRAETWRGALLVSS
jgi:hypothetical protein